jgi:hypothetical protein
VPPTKAPEITAAPVTVATPVMPTGAPLFTAAPYNPYAVSNATLEHHYARGNVSLWKAEYHNASHKVKQCKFNVSHFAELEKKHTKVSEDLRANGVVKAKKVALANVTKAKVLKALNSAFFAQKGASTSSQANQIRMNNAHQAKMYYERELIDVKEHRRKAEKMVHIAKVAVQKAMSDLHRAKRAEQRHHAHHHSLNKRARMVENSNQKLAERISVQYEMEKAFDEASLGRQLSNTPVLGQAVDIVSTPILG